MLCLHGYHGSGTILRRQMAPLARVFPTNVEFLTGFSHAGDKADSELEESGR
jgi:hypothetical protein